MRVLILGMNYAPEVTGIAPYTAGLAEHLVARGHQVTVATTFPHYPEWTVRAPYAGRWRTSERRADVDIRRSRVVLPRPGSARARIAYDTSLALGTLLNALPSPRADLVLGVSPPIQVGLTGALLARLWGARLVLLIKDLPLDAALAVGLLRPGKAYQVGRRLEWAAYRAADQIIVISAGFREHLQRQGVPGAKIVEIPDWADLDQVRPLPPDPAIRDFLGAGPADFLVLHTGNMGEKQGLSRAVAAAQLANGSTPWKLTLVGDGSERPQLEALVAQQRLSNVRLLPLQPSEVFPRLLAAADTLLLNQRANVIDSVAPSKLLAYMAAGRPVLAAVHPDSEAAVVIRTADCGVLVPPDEPDALAGAAARLARDASLRARLGANGRRYAEAHYARDRVLARYEACLSQLVNPEVYRAEPA